MFSFVFNQKAGKKDYEIVINEHSFECSKRNAQRISKTINNYYNSQEKDGKKENNKFIISIPEFENALICSEDDYHIFEKIFCLNLIYLTSSNKEVLKIFATKFEITELLTLIALFEQFEDTITNDENLQLLKDISSSVINITEDNFDKLLEDLQKIQQDILTKEFIYNFFLTASLVRPTKIELLMNFLKKYQEITNGGQFDYFKELIIDEQKENPISNEIRFLATYLHKDLKIKEPTYNMYSQFSYYYNNNNPVFRDEDGYYTKEEINEYKETGFCPRKIYNVIKEDNVDMFIEMMTSEGKDISFNNQLPKYGKYERSTDIYKTKKYIDLAAFYGSENIFNYILLNVENKEQTLKSSDFISAIIGGSISIVREYLENIEIDNSLLVKSIVMAIKYNHNEIFEYLFENNNLISLVNDESLQNPYEYVNDHVELSLNDYLIVNAIQYINYEALLYLITNGLDYTSLAALSLFYNQFYLADFALKIPYECKFSSSMKDKILYPFIYRYGDESIFFISIYKGRLDYVKKIINSKGFRANIVYQKVGPLFFAVINNQIEIVKFLLNDKRFLDKQVCDDINLFQYAIGHGYTELSEILINNPNININGQWNFLYESIKEDICDQYKSRIRYIHLKINPEDLIHYLVTKSENEKIKKTKSQIVNENKDLFACVAARYSNEEDFVKFLDDYKVDINSAEKSISLSKITPLITSVLNPKYDILKVILTKYKDIVNINHQVEIIENLYVFKIGVVHLLCSCTGRNFREGDKMLLKMENLELNTKIENYDIFYTPIQYAAYLGNFDMILELLKIPRVDVNELDAHRNTILHLLFENPYVKYNNCEPNIPILLETIKAIIEKKVDIMAVNDLV